MFHYVINRTDEITLLFGHVNLAVETLSKTVSTLQETPYKCKYF